MRNTNKMDTIKEWVQDHKAILIQVAAVITIAVVVGAIMIHDIAPSRAAFLAEVQRLDTGITTVGSTVSSLGTKVVNVEGTAKANQQALDGITDMLDEATGNMSALRARLYFAQDQIQSLTAELERLEALVGSPPEAYLTGTFGNYTIHAKASQAGNFTAIIHLAYDNLVVVGNSTYQEMLEAFYGSIEWDADNLKAYVPALSYDGTAWGVTRVSFSAGAFELEAKTEKAIEVLFGGLSVAYAPDWAYVEIWPALKEG